MSRSLAQQQASARTLLQNAVAQGKTAEEAIAYAIAALGKDSELLVRTTWRNHFTVMGGAG